jgi:hypothetical protein
MNSVDINIYLVISCIIALVALFLVKVFKLEGEVPSNNLKQLRSPFSLSRLEIIVALAVGAITWVGLRYILYKTLPWNCMTSPEFPCNVTYGQSWHLYGSNIFSSYSIPMAAISSVSSIFFIRCIRGDVQHFSRLGNFALAWPMICFPFINLLDIFSQGIIPIGLGLGLAASIMSISRKRNWGNLISIPLCIVWVFYSTIYFYHWFEAFGD